MASAGSCPADMRHLHPASPYTRPSGDGDTRADVTRVAALVRTSTCAIRTARLVRSERLDDRRPARLSAPPGLACRVRSAVRVAQAEDEPPGFEPKIRAHGTAGEDDSLDDRRVIRSPSERGPGELQPQWNELE